MGLLSPARARCGDPHPGPKSAGDEPRLPSLRCGRLGMAGCAARRDTNSQRVENSLCSPTARTSCTCSRLPASTPTLQDISFTRRSVGLFDLPSSTSWAELLTRWAAAGNEESPARRLSALRVPLITAGVPRFLTLSASRSMLSACQSSCTSMFCTLEYLARVMSTS